MAERFNWRAKASVDLLVFLSLRKRKQVAMGLRGMGDRSETERGPEPSAQSVDEGVSSTRDTRAR